MITIGTKLDRKFRDDTNANFQEADNRLDTLESAVPGNKEEVNERIDNEVAALNQKINDEKATLSNTILAKEQESISRDNDHKNSPAAHAAENVTYSGKVSADDVKEAIDKLDDRVSNIVGQSGTSNTEIVDARPSVDGTANTTLKQRLDKMENRQVYQSKQSAQLIHGLNVLNTSQATSFDPIIQGRTLANLWLNATTEDLKYYIATFFSRSVGFSLNGVYTYANTKWQGIKTVAPVLMADFANKVSGSTVENPHITKAATSNTLLPPSSFSSESAQTAYDSMKTLSDGNLNTVSTTGLGNYAQRLKSFNPIRNIEDNYGTIPRTTVADKVQWIKDNVAKITANAWVSGSGPAGNKATFTAWHVVNAAWSATVLTNLTGAVAKLSTVRDVLNYLDANGFIHYLAYAEPSDGVTASTINTDYINIEVELKPGTKLRPTKLGAGIYEVDSTIYNLANVDPNYTGQKLLDRFPYVDGVKHVQNPAITVQGKNLLPPFTEWTLHANATVKSAYELELVASGSGQNTHVLINVLPNTTYTLSSSLLVNSEARIGITEQDSAGNTTVAYTNRVTPSAPSASFTTNANTRRIQVHMNNNTSGTFIFTNPMLNLGTAQEPFEPKNEDVLYAPVKLASNMGATVRDELFKRDGQWLKSKRFETVVLDGSLKWNYSSDYTGFKRFYPDLNNLGKASLTAYATKFDGKALLSKDGVDFSTTQSDGAYINSSGIFVLSVSDTDTGFGETYTPNANEIKAYFNGWQAKTVDVNGKPTAWKNIIDGTDAPTQTEAYVAANKAAGYTPYELTYQLAVTKEEPVNVEGAISLHEGQNQVDVNSGVIVRERANPKQNSTSLDWFINAGQTLSAVIPNGGELKNKSLRIVKVYKNGVEDKKWIITTNTGIVENAYGKERAYISKSDYDPTATYEVTYLVLDKHLMTANTTDVTGSYNTNLKTNVNGLTERMGDLTSQVSINTRLLIDLLVWKKSMGG